MFATQLLALVAFIAQAIPWREAQSSLASIGYAVMILNFSLFLSFTEAIVGIAQAHQEIVSDRFLKQAKISDEESIEDAESFMTQS
ncbi:hypothetical protein HDV03_004244 [Kappamyces sp. JEL0829]|nr:hypothetical protein HDV03_004244 [Kappamyces sp. JEL0829]